MADLWVVAAAVAAAAGAWWALPVPWWLGAAGAGLALWRRWPAVLCVALLLLAAGLAHRSLAGATPLPAGPVGGEVTLLDDPVERFGAVRATARLGRAHVELWARRGAAGQLRRRLAGERLTITGRIEPMSPATAERLARRHVRAQVRLDAVTGWSPGDPASTAANRIRRTIEEGALVLPRTDRSLFLGFVLGDDRSQSAAVVTTFRESGLAHLTAVSGQNVAFLLLVARPGLQRLGLRGRWLGTLALIVWFAPLTRFEPSVLRASVMAGAGRHVGVPGAAGVERPVAGAGRDRPAAARPTARLVGGVVALGRSHRGHRGAGRPAGRRPSWAACTGAGRRCHARRPARSGAGAAGGVRPAAARVDPGRTSSPGPWPGR